VGGRRRGGTCRLYGTADGGRFILASHAPLSKKHLVGGISRTRSAYFLRLPKKIFMRTTAGRHDSSSSARVSERVSFSASHPIPHLSYFSGASYRVAGARRLVPLRREQTSLAPLRVFFLRAASAASYDNTVSTMTGCCGRHRSVKARNIRCTGGMAGALKCAGRRS